MNEEVCVITLDTHRFIWPIVNLLEITIQGISSVRFSQNDIKVLVLPPKRVSDIRSSPKLLQLFSYLHIGPEKIIPIHKCLEDRITWILQLVCTKKYLFNNLIEIKLLGLKLIWLFMMNQDPVTCLQIVRSC